VKRRKISILQKMSVWRNKFISPIFKLINKIFPKHLTCREKQKLLSANLLGEVLSIGDFRESTVRLKNVVISVVRFTLPEIDFLVVCQIPNQFPVFPPRIIVVPPLGNEFELPIDWNYSTDEPPEHQLGRLIDDALFREVTALQTVRPQDSIIYGPVDSKVAATSDQTLAVQQGWQPIYSQKRVSLDITDKYFARSGGILSQKLSEKCVSVFGCGSGGSYLAEQLVRSGVGKLILCDMEIVEAENLCRSGYEIADLGVPKVEALARKLRNVNPSVQLRLYNRNLMDLPHEQLQEIIESSQVVIAGTDMPKAEERLNKYAYQLGIPAVFPGLYQHASGGEVVMTIPRKTPCFKCSLGHRWDLIRAFQPETEIADMTENLGRVESEVDYSTGTLKAEPALAGDIQHLDSITLKLVWGLLLQDIPDEQPCETRDFIRGLSPQSSDNSFATKNFVITCHSPNFWFFPLVRDDPKQDYAYHSVWSETSEYRRLDCPVCGNNPDLLKPSISINQVLNPPHSKFAPNVVYP
jgi:molybdopterin/thiamine biosynthesis adenylyltransferase